MAFKKLFPAPPKHANGWYGYDAQGRILRLVHGITVVPYRSHGGWWDCVVVNGNEVYPRGGHHLYIPEADLLTAEEIQLAPPG
jgi:hypothetical protein